MHWLPAILALLIMASGWYYAFYSRAAEKLSGVEAENANRQRVRLRRCGGAVMLLLGVGIFAGVYWVDPEHPAKSFALIWMGVCGLLGLIVLLALLDLRLTWKLRKRQRNIP